MTNIVNKAHENGIEGSYWVSVDGLKMLGDYIMCAGHPDRYGEIVETSRGLGVIVDTGDFIKDYPNAIDIAVSW